MRFYCLDNYRTAEQLAEMRRLEAAGLCLFCPEGLSSRPDRPVLFRTQHWIALPNDFPYAGTRLHVLLVPGQHVGDVLDLDAAAQADFWAALGQVRERYGLTYYALGMRNGDCRYTAASIVHVHAHVMVGDPATEPEVPIRMRLSSRPRPS